MEVTVAQLIETLKSGLELDLESSKSYMPRQLFAIANRRVWDQKLEWNELAKEFRSDFCTELYKAVSDGTLPLSKVKSPTGISPAMKDTLYELKENTFA